jgi:phage host-nuclease inhibitor protein Gam
MTNEEVVVLMNKYMDLKSQASSLEADKKKLIDETMPKEIREKIAEIEEEFAGKNEKAQKILGDLEEEIKNGIVSTRETLVVKGLKASFHPGRVTWDAKALEGVVKSNPDVAKVIAPFKKQGKDYASFRFDKE